MGKGKIIFIKGLIFVVTGLICAFFAKMSVSGFYFKGMSFMTVPVIAAFICLFLVINIVIGACLYYDDYDMDKDEFSVNTTTFD